MTTLSTNRETTVSTTKMSSKGQVVIPEQIRAQLNLEAGSQFVVVGDKDVVILKRISAPTLSEFDGLIKQARSQAKIAGLKFNRMLKTPSNKRGVKCESYSGHQCAGVRYLFQWPAVPDFECVAR